ncbi:MAG TPA: ATP-dependent RecD-like DNA helicase [Candidatus Aminicenantes bacterium]|nr:ATP-dependent RecD-like DNA helicase [Candidatus Aminicenantes bacterium]
MDVKKGTIEEVIYFSPETGYSVFTLITEEGENITVVGNFPPLAAGELLKIEGNWEVNPRYGRQLRARNFIPLLPSSVKGIEKFLASGLIKGIGPVLAQRITNVFQDRTLDIISSSPEKLLQIEGIGQKKLKEIKKAWAEHEDIRELIIFLQQYNVSTSLATRIYRHYGEKSFFILKQNPYQVCYDIWGIGFKTADEIAMKLGLKANSPERIKAYIYYLLKKATEEGHVFGKYEDLLITCQRDLGVAEEEVVQVISSLQQDQSLVIEDQRGEQGVYLPYFYLAEEEVAQLLIRLAEYPVIKPLHSPEKTIKEIEQKTRFTLTGKQRMAIQKALNHKVLVLTGGPGTGKTTIIYLLAEILHQWGRRLLLAAPTGRAAKRLSEATGREAKTIHRLLEYNPKTSSFRRNEQRPLVGDFLVVDEFSMVDLPLMHSLLRALPHWMHLVLVGDKDQLPSVGPGNILHDLIESSQVEVVVLDEIFRQEKGGLIVQNAHRVNAGQSLIYPPRGEKDSDFYFINQEDEEKAFQLIVDLCTSRIPHKLGIPPLSLDIQVISPMYRGLVGVDHLNRELQKRLNPSSEGLRLGTRQFKVRDKVMQLRNNYEKDVYNGDMGTIVHVDKNFFRLFVDFEGRVLVYEQDELNEISLAYALSVHKAQGSEYQAVVIPLMTQHYIMLQRNLFYTALTRAKKLCVIVGTYKALHIAIKNNKPILRNTSLKDRLQKWAHKLSSQS